MVTFEVSGRYLKWIVGNSLSNPLQLGIKGHSVDYVFSKQTKEK